MIQEMSFIILNREIEFLEFNEKLELVTPMKFKLKCQIFIEWKKQNNLHKW